MMNQLFPLTAGKDVKSAQQLEEVVRVLDEILAEMKQNNAELREHNRVVSSLDEKVRKIGINITSL